MKLTKQFKLSLLISSFLISSIISATTVLQDSQCANPCSECQRVVYQMKFHKIADCEVNGVCKGTCYKIKEVWASAFNPFEPFLKDMFGKCEICFRAGHCKISDCKEQARNEQEVINQIVSGASLTGKVHPDTMVEFPQSRGLPVDIHTLPKLQKLNTKVENIFNKEIKDALAMGTATALIPQVQNLVHNFFDKPFDGIRGGAFTVLNHNGQISSTANVSYWNEGLHKNNNELIKNNTKKTLSKLEKTIGDLNQLNKTGAKGKEQSDAAKVTKKSKKQIKKIEKKFNKAEDKLKKKEIQINRLLSNPAVVKDEAIRSKLNNSLDQVKQYGQVVNQVKNQIQSERNKIQTHKRS